jgi:ELWxxDGT repeat protein
MLKKPVLAQAFLSATLVLTGCGADSAGDGSAPATGKPEIPPVTSPVTIPDVEQALFAAYGDINTGNELWITDGTETGTKFVKDINASGHSHPYNFTQVGSKWFFNADDDIHGVELWITDGTEAGTSMVKDIRSGTSSSHPANLIAYKGELIFSATDALGDTELWISNGTEVGTHLIKNIHPNISSRIGNTVLFNDLVYFTAKDENYARQELWKTDGTAAGTGLAAQINPNPTNLGDGSDIGSTPGLLTPFGNELVMVADNTFSQPDPTIELELFTYWLDGSTRKHDLLAGKPSSKPNELTVIDDSLYFVAKDNTGYNIWAYRDEQLHPMTNFTGASAGSAPKFLTAVGDKLYFVANEPIQGSELWVTNGTPAGTPTGARPVKDINAGNLGSAIRDLNSAGDKLLFIARGNVHTEEDSLWVSDGTEAGTVEISKISATGSDPELQQFVMLNDKLLFSADDAIHGAELWSSDGTSANTSLVKDINPDASSSYPAFFEVQAR